MFTHRFRDQIRMAEERFEEHKEQRQDRLNEIHKIDQGQLAQVDLTKLDDQQRFSRRLALSALSREVVIPREAAAATFPANRDVLLERIIKSNDLMSSAFLIAGERARRTVGRVVIRSASGTALGFGTGSMISPRLMITNNHVLDSVSTAANSTIQFDFVDMFDGTQLNIAEFSLTPNEFFQTDEHLDFTIVAVASSNQDGTILQTRGWVPLIAESGKAVVGERVNIIQHPGGRPQQVAVHQNRIIDVVGDFLHYESDTEQGSSGSPVANNAWQTAALHHAGVPKRDTNGRILLTSGVPWDGSNDTIHLIHWIANEGTRISRIVEHLNNAEASMSPQERALLAEVNSAPPRQDESASESRRSSDSHCECSRKLRLDGQGRVVYTIPVEIAVGVPGEHDVNAVVKAHHATQRPSSGVIASDDEHINQRDLEAAEAAFRAHESDEYYDEAADSSDVSSYYDTIAGDADLVGKPLFSALHKLVKDTHTTVFSYKKARLEHLYPWIDLHPDRKLKSIYSGEGFDAREVIRMDLEVAAQREAIMSRFLATEAAKDLEAMEMFLEQLEASSPFNCEHVVPQSWFAEKQPMKADLHHLFTCESDCNSFRSNIPYFEFPPIDEAFRPKCGRRETNDRFEPTSGKGIVARATLYFLIRYPRVVGDEARELQEARLPILLKWHKQEPVAEYERHRNAAIRAAQGNRNPLIDFPEWAEHIDFSPGFGS